jgi:uncharacterized protein YmfQ (DUF2313 family)
VRRNSEKIQEILTSTEGQKIIDYISPIYDDAYVALWLLQVAGLQLDEMAGWMDDLWSEIIPQTTKLLISYWEAEYGIQTDKSLSILQRRNTLLAKIRTRAPINPYRMRKIVAAICGLPTRIEENVAKNTFHVYISALGKTGIDETAIQYAVNKIKPAHLIYEIKYEQGVESSFYAAFVTNEGVIFTGKQVN